MRVNAYIVCAFNYVIHLPGEIRQTDRQTDRKEIVRAGVDADLRGVP